MRLVVGITGATGVVYGIRLLDVLRSHPEVGTHLVLSTPAKRTIVDPRPPPPPPVITELRWTARPDVTGHARVDLDFASTVGTRYRVFVSNETLLLKALEQAVASSRTALAATQAGFDVGTRTIVDVLNSQRALYLAITNYYQSRYTYIGNVLRLKLAAGTLKVQDLEQIDRWLRERKPPEEVIREDEADDEARNPDN